MPHLQKIILFLLLIIVPVHSVADTENTSSASPILEKQTKKKKGKDKAKTKKVDYAAKSEETTPLIVMSEEEFAILQKRNKDDGLGAKRKPFKPEVTIIERYLKSEGIEVKNLTR